MPRKKQMPPTRTKQSKKTSPVAAQTTAARNKRKRAKHLKFNPWLALAIFAVIGFILIRVFASTTVQPNPPGSTSTCGATVSGYTYRVPFGDSAWNIPTCNMPLFANDTATAQGFGKLMYNYGQIWNASSCYFQGDCPDGKVYKDYTGTKKGIEAQKGRFMTQFGLAGPEADYSQPVYHFSAATLDITKENKQIIICGATTCLPSNLDRADCKDKSDWACTMPQTPIPWKSEWKPAGGNDKEMVIINDDTGVVYNLWQVDFAGGSCALEKLLNVNNAANRLCVAAATIIRDKDKNPANYYTYNQGVTAERGLGIHDAAMTVTPEEVAQGEIRHALTMETIATKFGPECVGLPKTVDKSFLTKTCGYAVAPAAMFEWVSASDINRETSCSGLTTKIADFNTKQTFGQLFTNDKMIPEGMRFKITSTDAEIDAWINTRSDLKSDSAKAKTAKIFARALRDYGWIVGDTTCNGSGFTVAGAANPDAKTKWANLGIKDASSQYLLDGLFTENNIVALQPPTNNCLDGTTTQLFCKWVSSVYPASVTKSSNTTPTPTASNQNVQGMSIPTNSIAPTPTVTKSASPTVAATTNTTVGTIPTNVSVSGSLIPNWTKYDLKISWTASTVSGGIKQYVLLRDGKEIYRGTNRGYLDVMDLKYQHVYSVQAIGNNGNASVPVLYTAKPWCILIVCGLGT